MFGLTQRKGDISQSCILEAIEGVALFLACSAHCAGQFAKSLACYCREQIFSVAEVPVRSIVRHSGSPRDLARGKRGWSNFTDQRDRRGQEGFSQILNGGMSRTS